MDDNKKKSTASRKINIKNKKMAEQKLSKTTSKKTSTKKAPTSKKGVPRKIVKKIDKIDLELKDINIIKEEPKEEKVVSTEPVTKPKVKTTKAKVNIKTKPKSKATIKPVKEPEKKPIGKVRKIKKVNNKEPIKTKLEIPKEWQEINKKVKKQEDLDKTITTKLKKSIFEELDEREYKEKKAKEKEQIKKGLITLIIVIVSVSIVLLLLFRYNNFIKKQFTTYDTYKTGDKVTLEDDSIWYVIEDSDEKQETIKILFNFILDVNGDNFYGDEDLMAYNTENKSVYDPQNEDSVARYLVTTYRDGLEAKIGKIENVSLLTSKEYIAIREQMGFGYEWSSPNWLAHSTLESWWILSSQNEKVYVITATGAYKLYSPSGKRFIRPTIEIKKSMVKSVEKVDVELDDLTKKVKELAYKPKSIKTETTTNIKVKFIQSDIMNKAREIAKLQNKD